jgi:CBS domain-containing protein
LIAREAMTPAPLTVTPRTSGAAALGLARDNGINQLPVSSAASSSAWCGGSASWP